MGTEIGRLGGYGFRGTATAGDGSNQKWGKMGAGYVNLRKQRKRQQRKVGREEEGSGSNCPELAAFVLALRGTPVTSPMLYLYDNQALLKAVKRWVGESRKATLVGARKSDGSRTARRRQFTRSNRKAQKTINSRSSDVSGQGEGASRRTCK